MIPFVLVLLFSFLQAQIEKDLTHTPVIGVLSLPCDNDDITKGEYIEVYYSQYLNSAGAKVVPISFKLEGEELKNLMKKLNGIFFTGGGADFVYYDDEAKEYELTEVGKISVEIYKIAREFNDEGVYYPIWGTCMGFQLLAFLASMNPLIPKLHCDCQGYYAELYFFPEAHTSKMFSVFTKEEIKAFIEEKLTLNAHSYYVDCLDFFENPRLDEEFKILAGSLDKNEALPFIAAMEGRKYPFYGVQFHPELRQYEQSKRAPELKYVKLAQKFANFFVDEARKSSHRMSIKESIALSIWNTPVNQSRIGRFIYFYP